MKNKIYGNEMDKIPNLAFRLMSFFIRFHDIFKNSKNYLNSFGIKKNSTALDYGCGPGRHIKHVSELIGEKGLLYAADIHELAISAVEKIIKKNNLKNVKTVQVIENKVELMIIPLI